MDTLPLRAALLVAHGLHGLGALATRALPIGQLAKAYTLPGSHVHIGLVNVFLQVATGLYSLPGLRGSCSLPTSPGELKGRVFHSY